MKDYQKVFEIYWKIQIPLLADSDYHINYRVSFAGSVFLCHQTDD